MYVQVGDFRVSRGPSTVPQTQISRNAVFFKSQNLRKAGTLCTTEAKRILERLELHHRLLISEKAILILAGYLNSDRSYLITAVFFEKTL
jgi:hypothetical protein